MYKRSKLTGAKMKRKKKKEKKEKRRRENTKPSSTWQNMLIVCKCKSIRIEDQEHNEMVQRISSWVPMTVKSLTLMENVPP